MEALEKNSLAEVPTDNKELYQKNLDALKKHHPELAELIESLTIEKDRIKVLDSDTGQPRLLFKKDDGEEVLIHNAEDPAKCAYQAVDLLEKMEGEGVAVLFGFGLGYFAEEIFRRFEKGHILMIYEATPAVFKTALKTRDLSSLLESRKVKIILGTDANNFSVLHDYHHLIVNGMFWIVKHFPSTMLNESAYDTFYNRLNEEKMITESGVSTAVNLGKEFINSFMSNIHQIIRKPGVSKLKDVFKGRPAIIVSAGPSLEKNFHVLKKAKGKAVIIAVDVVLPILLPAGVIPDVIVAIDPLPENIAVFRDNPLLKDVPFICLAQYTPEILDVYPGPVFINSVPQNLIYQWLSSLWEDKGYIECFGGSVAHLAFGVAEYIGADTIGIIGQDLSYEKKMHAGETSQLLADFHKKDAPDNTKSAREIEDIFGEKRYTNHAFLTFRTSFETKIRAFKGSVVNATEGGLSMKGAVPMRLDDFINEYCDLQEIDTFSILSEIADGDVTYNLDAILAVVSEARDIFSEIKKNSNRVLKHIKRVKSLKEKGEKDTIEFNNILTKVESLIEEIKHPILNLLTGYNYRLELFMKRKDMQDIDEMEDKWERLDNQLERGSTYYEEIIKTINLFNKQLDKLHTALKREKKINTILFDESIAQSDKYSRAGLIYSKAGIVSQSVKYLEFAIGAEADTQKSVREAQNITDSQPSLYGFLAEMYLKQFRFYDAREILNRVRSEQTSYANKIDNLMIICDEKIKAWEARKQRTGRLIEKAEADYGSYLESGYFYFRIKDFKRAEEAYLKAIESMESKVEAYYGLAHTYLAIDDIENAFEVLEKAIEMDPTNPILYRDMGLIALQNNNIEPAELFFLKAIELAPREASLYKFLADFYINLGNKEKAIALYESALQATDDNPVIQQNLAMIYSGTIANAEAE